MNTLQRLYVARTGITGELPQWLSALSLTYLDISSNMLAGDFPTWVGNMTSLYSLNVSTNGFRSNIPS
ncbi:hypothetical protein MKX01_021420, partial [Papaver californicum]